MIFVWRKLTNPAFAWKINKDTHEDKRPFVSNMLTRHRVDVNWQKRAGRKKQKPIHDGDVSHLKRWLNKTLLAVMTRIQICSAEVTEVSRHAGKKAVPGVGRFQGLAQ